MIFVTGDTHGSFDFYKLTEFAQENPNLTKNDYVIIAGDFGAVWSPKTLDLNLAKYTSLQFTVLFVDGNHENFDMLDAYPVEKWKGGKVHKIADDIIHLMRGQVYEIEDKRILTLGGATSVDKDMRTPKMGWWEQEAIAMSDVDEALKNLARYDGCVDYVITHSCSAKLKQSHAGMFSRYAIGQGMFEENLFLNIIEDNLKDFKQWYFGHFHFDHSIDKKHTALYQDILQLC